MLKDLHLQEPLWLLALIPVVIILWLASQTTTSSRAWGKIIDPKLLPLLLQGEDRNTYKFPKILLAISWIIAVVALGDPVWEKISKPVFQTNAARVLVLDLSNSMLIDDLKPNRLSRARFKIEDILSQEEEGQTGLVLFAGEAFAASPLTRDTETIRSMLTVLTPQLMPVQGSRADLGLMKAHELLKQAGSTNGQVLLIADGVSQEAASLSAAESLKNNGHTVSVLAVGTEKGGKLNFQNDTSVSVKLDSGSLRNIARNGGGNYHLITTNNSDLKDLLNPISDNKMEEKQRNNEVSENQEWQSTGPLFVLLLIPFAALAFRKGWLLNVFIMCLFLGLVTQPQDVMAADEEIETQWGNLLETLSKNKAQRANNALINEQYEKARDLSDDSFAKGSAEYKLENYEEALKNFKNIQGADARYNEGNSLVQLEKYDEAIAAYDEAIKLNSTMQDAIDNKKSIEDFLKKQDQQQQSEDQQSSDENQQSNSEDQKSQDNQQSEDSKEDQNKQGSESANNSEEGEQSQAQEKEKEKKKDQESDEANQENQFSDANKDMNKDKEDAEKSESMQPAEGDKESAEKTEENKANELSEETQNDKQDESVNAKRIQKQAADELSKEEKMAAEQWLRRIPDDPGGLLRRKFRHQYNKTRRSTSSNSTEQPW